MSSERKVQVWKNLRPRRLIDREDVLQDILTCFQRGEKVFYLLGEGGIGKTRLLEAIRDGEFTKQGRAFLTVGIFDIYHPRYHTVSGIEKAVVNGVENAFLRAHLSSDDLFSKYKEAREKYDSARAKGYPALPLEEQRKNVSEAFWSGFKNAAASTGSESSLLFLFDTMELLFHQEDDVERLLGERPAGLEIVDWLRRALQENFEYSNVHFLLSGRLERNWYVALQEGTAAERRLGPLTPEGVEQYLLTLDESLKKEGVAHLLPENREDRSEFVKSVQEWSRGKPLRLAFITMLKQQDKWPLQSPPNDKAVDLTLIKMIMDMVDPLGIVLPYVAFLRKGVTPGLLHQLLEEHRSDLGWKKEYIESICDELKAMPFVKVRPDDRRIFLHDEMYRVMSPILMALGTELREIADIVVRYYANREDADEPTVRAEKLYYRAILDWQEALAEYRRLSDEAIAEHRTGNDLLYRDEMLRYLNDYGIQPKKDLDSDATIRWLKRLLAMGKYEQVVSLSNSIREKGLQASLNPEDRSVFHVYEAEAMIYTGKLEEGIAQLQDAIKSLAGAQTQVPKSYEEIQRKQAYIRAYNDIGYAWTRRYDYWEAASAYGQALKSYQELAAAQAKWQEAVKRIGAEYGKSVLSDWADTLKNTAFTHSRLGRHRAAYILVNESDKLYKSVQNQYGHALALSALGAIFAERQWYCNSQRVLEESLRSFKRDVPDERGEALASFGLGRASRRLVDLENIQGRKEEFAHLLEESEQYLLQAEEIFIKEEPARLPEVYQELGCLYRDKLAFQVRMPGKQNNDIEAYREKSNEFFDKAFDLSESALQKADIFVDRAEVHYHYGYKEGYGRRSALPDEEKKGLEEKLKEAEEFVPRSYRYPYRLPYSSEEYKDPLWWQIMGKIHLLKGHMAFKGGQFEEALEEYLESFLFFDLYSEEASLFSIASRTGRRLYSKFARMPETDLQKMENMLLQKGDKRRILDRPGWRSLLRLVRDARMHTAPYVL